MSKGVTLPTETVFVMEMTPIKFSAPPTRSATTRSGGVRKALIFTGRHVALA